MKTASSLRTYTSKDLAQIAKKKGVAGWHSMRKEQLVQAILKAHKRNGATRKATTEPSGKKKAPGAKKVTKVARKIHREHVRRENMKDLALQSALKRSNNTVEDDRIILIVRDPFWLQAYWEVTKASVLRAKAALAENWHGAKPILRLVHVSDDNPNGAVEQVLREIPIHGGVKNWYIDVSDPPGQYRVLIGYKTTNDKFHMIARSNRVKTPEPENCDHDENWTDIAEDYEKYYALSGGYSNDTSSGELKNVFEEKLRRPMHNIDPHNISHSPVPHFRPFDFEVDAHMIVYGATDPGANVTLAGEPVKLETDGTFSIRMGLPDRRQVLPIVASSRDGSEQRTTVLAIERNTKVMEPITRDQEEL